MVELWGSGDSAVTVAYGGGGSFFIGRGTVPIDCEEFSDCSQREIIFVMHSFDKEVF